jgi:hypothetical protein
MSAVGRSVVTTPTTAAHPPPPRAGAPAHLGVAGHRAEAVVPENSAVRRGSPSSSCTMVPAVCRSRWGCSLVTRCATPSLVQTSSAPRTVSRRAGVRGCSSGRAEGRRRPVPPDTARPRRERSRFQSARSSCSTSEIRQRVETRNATRARRGLGAGYGWRRRPEPDRRRAGRRGADRLCDNRRVRVDLGRPGRRAPARRVGGS